MLDETALGGALLRRCARGLIVALALAAGLLTLDVRPTAADGATETAAPEAIVHQVPQVPLTIDGAPVPGGAITKYNGRPLYMAVTPGGGPNGQLQAFTEPADFERFVRQLGGPEHAAAKPQRALAPESTATRIPASPPKGPESGPGQNDTSVNSAVSFLYSGDNGTFYQFTALAGSAVGDLTQVDMVCFVWCVSWNDEASSASSGNGLVLFEHIGFRGSVLFIPGGVSRPFLSHFGWDNRTSSFRA